MANYKLVDSDKLDADMTSVADKLREKSETAGKLLWPSGFIDAAEQCSSLNFSVVGGTTQPSNPKENTIWVNTDKAVKGWAFSVTEPDNPVEGMVWIQTGQSSTVAFNALKKENLQVYPLSAKQYVNSTFVDVSAKIYRANSWTDIIQQLWIVKDGITTYAFNVNTGSASIATDGTDLVFKTTDAGYHTLKLLNIDLTNHDTLHVVINSISGFTESRKPTFNIYNKSGDVVATKALPYQGSVDFTIDISSLTGMYDIGMYWEFAGVVKVTSMYAPPRGGSQT